VFDGGVLMNQAIHNLDLLIWLGGPVQSVQAYTATRFRNIESEDVAAGIIRFESGALGIIEAAATVYPSNFEESIALFGERGTALIGGTTANWIRHWEFEGLIREEAERIVKSVESDPFGTPGHQLIIRDMIDAIRNDREPIVSGKDGRNALELVSMLCDAAVQHSLDADVINAI
jgi:predicted dehydrogenase